MAECKTPKTLHKPGSDKTPAIDAPKKRDSAARSSASTACLAGSRVGVRGGTSREQLSRLNGGASPACFQGGA